MGLQEPERLVPSIKGFRIQVKFKCHSLREKCISPNNDNLQKFYKKCKKNFIV